MNKLLLVDGNSISNRAFYALPFLTNHEGNPSGAIYGFANILLKLLQEEKITNVVVAFDHARKTFRNEIYSEYKMQRKPSPEELIVQFPKIKEMLDKMDIKYFEVAGIEADDIIGTITKKYDGEKIILSSDRDLLQLIDDKTDVWLTKKGVTEIDKVNENRLKELYNLKPYQIIELKGLMGDASDNIPGVKGVGEKTALSLLEKYETIDNLYAHIDEITGKLKEKLIDDRDSAYLSKELATIKRDCELDYNENDFKINLPFKQKLYSFFEGLDFFTLLKNKELFDNTEIKAVQNNTQRVKITDNILENLAKKRPKVFCYDLQNLEFLFDNTIYYLDKNFTIFDNIISIESVCSKFKDIFEDEDILKITKTSKDDLHFLTKQNIVLRNYFDITLADYLITAGLKSNIGNAKIDEYKTLKENLLKQIKDKSLTFIYEEIEYPLINLLFEMENRGFKINEEKLEEISIEFNEKIKKLQEEIYIDANEEFNINSPKQVAHILFDKLGIKSYNNKKQSTSANILEELRFIPIVDKILLYRKYSKFINTYIDVYKDLCKQSNIIHTTFNQTLTSTGRLSSSEPNLQNIPTRDDEGKILRKLFISKFENGSIISADYNQIELRLLADMSGEEGLIDAYNRGDDIHALTASHIFNKPIEEITPNERRDAKAVNFGIIYGISDYGLSQNIKSTRAMAKDFIESYFIKYPKVKMFMDSNIAYAKDKGYSITKFGRIRQIPELSSSKYQTRTFGERVAMNMPLQGTASDIIKIAMLKVDNEIKKHNLKSQLILQIHDELIIDTYPGEEEQIEKILKENMENVVKLKVPLIVSVGRGKNLFDCK